MPLPLTSASAVPIKLAQGRVPLFLAAISGHEGVVRSLLAAGASPSLPGRSGMLPIHAAVITGQPAATRLLLHATPQAALKAAEARSRCTLLEMAVETGDNGMVRTAQI